MYVDPIIVYVENLKFVIRFGNQHHLGILRWTGQDWSLGRFHDCQIGRPSLVALDLREGRLFSREF